MDRSRRPTHLSWLIVGVLAIGLVGCSKDDGRATPVAKAATPDPFSMRSSRIIASPVGEATANPLPEAESAAASAVTDRVVITTGAEPESGGAPLTVKFSAAVERGPSGLRYRWEFG